jgi:hypothetical protein
MGGGAGGGLGGLGPRLLHLPLSPTGVNDFAVVALSGGFVMGGCPPPLAARRMRIAASTVVRQMAVRIT